MAVLVAKAYNPTNGSVEEIYEGFSWSCLLFGFLWYIYKGMWGWGLISFILAIATYGFSWLIFPFFANGQHAESLLKQGYLNEKQWKEKKDNNNQVNNQNNNSSVADELSKLVALKEQGILTDEEFLIQKDKLLS